MLRTWITVILFALLLLESTVMPWLLPEMWQNNVLVSPRFVFIVIIYLSLYVSRILAFVYGLAFGMLHDLVFYGPMIGTYSFIYGLCGYVIGLFFQNKSIRLMTAMSFMIVGNFLLECIHYALYRLFDIISVSFQWALLHQILPSVMFNVLIALLIYVPIRKIFEKMNTRIERL